MNPSDAPIIIIGLTSDIYDRPALYDAASTILQQKLSQIDGVGQVLVGGGTLPSVRVNVDPTKLNSMGLTLQNVQSVLSLQNSDQPTGQISNDLVTADIITNDQLFRAEEYKPLVIGFNRGAMPQEMFVEQIRRFASDVLPRVQAHEVKCVPTAEEITA